MSSYLAHFPVVKTNVSKTPILIADMRALDSMAARMIQANCYVAKDADPQVARVQDLRTRITNRNLNFKVDFYNHENAFQRSTPHPFITNDENGHLVLALLFPDHSAVVLKSLHAFRVQPRTLTEEMLRNPFSLLPIPFSIGRTFVHNNRTIGKIAFQNRRIVLNTKTHSYDIQKATHEFAPVSWYIQFQNEITALSDSIGAMPRILSNLVAPHDHTPTGFVPPCLPYRAFSSEEHANMQTFLSNVSALIYNTHSGLRAPYRVTIFAGTRSATGRIKRPSIEIITNAPHTSTRLKSLYQKALAHPDAPIPLDRLKGRTYYRTKTDNVGIKPYLIFSKVVDSPVSGHALLEIMAELGTEWK